MTLETLMTTARMCLHVTRRNWKVYRKDFVANVSPAVADPALIILALGLGLGTYITTIEGRSYIAFLAPGLAVSTTLFTAFFETSYGFYVRLTFENIYKAMLTTPIGHREIILGEFLWVGLKGALMAGSVSLVLGLFGLAESFATLPLIVIMGFCVGICFGAIGLIASALVHNINQFQTVYSFLIAPVYFLSGIFYPLSEMPWFLRTLVEAFPLTHGVRMAQAIFWNQNVLQVVILSMLAITLQAIVFGSIAYRLIKRKLVT
jgi:lipooligosaccharide transport system permease protein